MDGEAGSVVSCHCNIGTRGCNVTPHYWDSESGLGVGWSLRTLEDSRSRCPEEDLSTRCVCHVSEKISKARQGQPPISTLDPRRK